MLPFLIPLLLATTASSSDFPLRKSAASAAQIRFAIENKYDDTGPGAKAPEYAYNTYKNLEDALLGYLDDPDTKLPEHERMRALKKLYKTSPYMGRFYGMPNMPSDKGRFVYQDRPSVLQTNEIGTSKNSYNDEPFSWSKIQATKSNPSNQAHYTKGYEPFDPHPQYSFSYGVHDKKTGDSKTAHETRDGSGTVLGYYSFRDADGTQRTVHYQSDDTHGFRATVKRSFEKDQ